MTRQQLLLLIISSAYTEGIFNNIQANNRIVNNDFNQWNLLSVTGDCLVVPSWQYAQKGISLSLYSGTLGMLQSANIDMSGVLSVGVIENVSHWTAQVQNFCCHKCYFNSITGKDCSFDTTARMWRPVMSIVLMPYGGMWHHLAWKKGHME